MTEPTEKDLNDPMFEAVWQAIKKWDLQREYGAGYAGATGTDVMTILNAVRPFFKDWQQKTLELLLPEKEDVDESSYNDPSIDGTGVSIGVNIARSEILRRASEAGIDISNLN